MASAKSESLVWSGEVFSLISLMSAARSLMAELVGKVTSSAALGATEAFVASVSGARVRRSSDNTTTRVATQMLIVFMVKSAVIYTEGGGLQIEVGGAFECSKE